MRKIHQPKRPQFGDWPFGTPARLGRRAWLGIIALALGGITPWVLDGSAAEEAVSESEFKAALLVTLVRFVLWPDSSFSSPSAALEIGVLGKNPFGKYLDRIASGKRLEDHPLKVRYASTPDELSSCHFVFVCRERNSTLNEIVKAFAGKSILLVGEEDRFASDGGMINVLLKEQKPYLQINARTAEHAGLRFRGNLAQTKNIEWIEKPSAETK